MTEPEQKPEEQKMDWGKLTFVTVAGTALGAASGYLMHKYASGLGEAFFEFIAEDHTPFNSPAPKHTMIGGFALLGGGLAGLAAYDQLRPKKEQPKLAR